MWLFRNRLTYFLLFFGSLGFAQTIVVQDAILRDLLCSRLPLAMDASCELVDTVKAESEYEGIYQIHLSNKGIETADELLYFKNVDTIQLNQNLLTSFPSNLSGFRSLGHLNLSSNQLTTAPDISYTNTLSGDTAVKLFYIKNNNLSSLPASWYLPNAYTQVVDLYKNYLTEIPSFIDYPEIRRLDVRENLLGFEELIPIQNHPEWGVEQFDLFPQKSFPLDVDTLVSLGETVTFQVSANESSNTYTLLKNNSNYITNTTGVFELPFVEESDTGSYWIKIRNSNFPDQSDFLSTVTVSVRLRETTDPTPEPDIVDPDPDVVVEPVAKEKDMFVFSPNDDGNFDSFFIKGQGLAKIYNKAGVIVRKEQLPFRWHGFNENGEKLQPGIYIIEKEDGEYLKVFIVY